MKRLSLFLAACLMLMAAVPAAAIEPFHYESKTLGFSMTVPNLPDEEIAVEESETGVSFFHAPSREKWGGLIGSIEVVSPRSKFFSEKYNNPAYQILAMGEDRIFLWKSPGDGVDTGKEMLEAFVKAASELSVDNLKKCLVPMSPDDQPTLNTTRHVKYLTAEHDLIRPDAPLTRGELAEMLYALLDADNKDNLNAGQFSDVDGKFCAQAVNYLASYGILSGYPDGTFRSEDPVTRAQFAVLLHRCQFIPSVGRYGDLSDFADVPGTYWAEAYIYSADILGWMTGDSNGMFHPARKITRAEAVTAINRMLGRDESHTYIEKGLCSFSDLDAGHWAYGNILEAAGVLSDFSESFTPKKESLPSGTCAYYFLNKADGWAVGESQLCRTTDGGETWDKLGEPFLFTVSGLFFFNSQDGLLLGSSEDSPCILLQTVNGGETWSSFPANPTAQDLHFPAEQFPTEKSMLEAIVSAELRPASEDAVYLTIRYKPYESIYVLNFEAVKQTAITVEELSSVSAQIA
jgi:hypothetical protein